MTRAWIRSCAACSVRKGLIFLMLCNANLQDRAVFVMWSLKVSWSSKITPRFLTELDGVIIDESNWMVKSCCRVGVAGKTRSLVFARLSCRWCSFIHAKMFSRQPEIRAATIGSSGWNMLNGEEEGSKNWSLRNPGDQFMCFGYLTLYYILYKIFK